MTVARKDDATVGHEPKPVKKWVSAAIESYGKGSIEARSRQTRIQKPVAGSENGRYRSAVGLLPRGGSVGNPVPDVHAEMGS